MSLEVRFPAGLNPLSVLLGVLLAITVGGWAAYALGPDPSAIAMLSKSDGLTVTYGAIYAMGAVAAAFLLLTSALWMLVGAPWHSGSRQQTALASASPPFSPSVKSLVLATYLLLGLSAAYFMFIRSDTTLLCTMEQDVFVYYDGAYRASAGQVPHVDFHTPLGAACYVLPYWGWKAAGGYAGSLEYASLITAAFLLERP